MDWVKKNAVPLAVGFAVGYVVAKKGGIVGTAVAAKSQAKRVAG